MKALLLTASLCLGAAPALARDDNPNSKPYGCSKSSTSLTKLTTTSIPATASGRKSLESAHLGARRTAPAQRINCDDFAHIVRLQIALESPAEARPENLLAITDYDSEDLLVARLRGKQLPSATDIPRFPAAWTTLSLRSADMDLTAGDCDLVHQLRKQVLPKLSVQVLNEPARCLPVLSRGGTGAQDEGARADRRRVKAAGPDPARSGRCEVNCGVGGVCNCWPRF